jgi:hypothetical protein
MNDDLMEPLHGLKLDDIGGVCLYDGCYDFETIFDDIKEEVGSLVGRRTDDGNVEEFFLEFG